MFDVKNVLRLVCLQASIFTGDFCIAQKSANQNTERKTMNDHKDFQKTSSDWIAHIKQSIYADKGTFQADDSLGNPITLEWELIDPTSPRLNQAIAQSSEVLVQMYTSMELQFAKKHPDTVGSEMFLKPIAPMFENGVDKVDWKVAQQQLATNLRQFLTTTDFAKYGSSNDIQIFVTAYDAKSGKHLGVIQFLVMPQFDYGTVKVAFFGIQESVQGRGIEQLLLSSIFQLIPDTSRIFLHTRITNESALSLYLNIEFVKFAGPLPFWVDMEYLTEKSHVLQKTAQSLIV
ncbi:MAG: hypothetical protein NTZ68_01730 [Candidatus Dependentiae bacterium]|nr:hypothetical protein [Candidatus Dependentiae bacterium]